MWQRVQFFKLKESFLASRVGRRICFQFVLCALVPIAVLAVVAFTHVRKQLNDQSQKNLHETSKRLGLGLYDRLLFLEAEMKSIASDHSMENAEQPPRGLGENIDRRFKGLVLMPPGGQTTVLAGRVDFEANLSAAEQEHIGSGKTLVSSRPGPDLTSRVMMIQAVNPKGPGQGKLIGEINPVYLWGLEGYNGVPENGAFCVLDGFNHPLMCSPPERSSLGDQLALRKIDASTGQFQWSDDGGEYLARYRSIFMRYQFFTPKWTVVVSESQADVFAAMADFKKVFPLVLIISLLAVLLLSARQIRRSLDPLERLNQGVRQIASGDFKSRVAIQSADEFQELGDAFNRMAGRLGQQFNTLATMGEIDRAILSVWDIDQIVKTVLDRWQEVFPCDCVSVSLLDPGTESRAVAYLRDSMPGSQSRVHEVQLTAEEIQTLKEIPEGIGVVQGDIPRYLAALTCGGVQSLLVFPILLNGGLCGVVCMGYKSDPSFAEEERVHARRLTDQVAVALSNAREIAERRRAQGEVRDHLDQLVALRDVFLAVSSTLNLNTLLDLLLKKIGRLLPNSAVTVWLSDKSSGLPLPVACSNLGLPGSDTWSFDERRAWGGVPNAAFEKRLPVRIDDIRQSKLLWEQGFFHVRGLISYLGVPLIANGEFLGSLSIYMKDEHRFSREEVDFYTTLAGQGAIAIHNSQIYEEMKVQADKLARANRVKNEFLNVMSHELRTPLTVIMGVTESMQEGIFGDMSERQQEGLKTVVRQSHDLLAMINTIMEAKGLESDAVTLEQEEFVLDELLDEIRTSAQILVMDKALSVSWDVPAERVVMRTDRNKVKRILQCLIHNGIKFTQRGDISVRARYLPATGTVEFAVADTGIGIPQEMLSVIFAKFTQRDSSQTRSYGGVGLGLYIVQAFTELLGGTVQVSSEVGSGSTFTVRIPATYLKRRSEPAPSAHGSKKEKALQTEDFSV